MSSGNCGHCKSASVRRPSFCSCIDDVLLGHEQLYRCSDGHEVSIDARVPQREDKGFGGCFDRVGTERALNIVSQCDRVILFGGR